MSFLKTVAEDEADDLVAAMYAADIEHNGYLPNYSRIFSLHPGAYQAWGGLILTIRGAMDRRRYELATIGAANQLRSTYCGLAHASILEERYFETEDLRKIVSGQAASVLSDVDREIVEFARKVADDATSVTEKDITRLREAGLTDRDIFDVVLAVAARSFFTKVLDATGTLADAAYNEMDAELRDALTVGRPIDGG
ncbi:MAG TPA: peroxidase [Acidimicrobiia bacterium]|nr:peroxidase [Acidimicrobiia bacterium]